MTKTGRFLIRVTILGVVGLVFIVVMTILILRYPPTWVYWIGVATAGVGVPFAWMTEVRQAARAQRSFSIRPVVPGLLSLLFLVALKVLNLIRY